MDTRRGGERWQYELSDWPSEVSRPVVASDTVYLREQSSVRALS